MLDKLQANTRFFYSEQVIPSQSDRIPIVKIQNCLFNNKVNLYYESICEAVSVIDELRATLFERPPSRSDVESLQALPEGAGFKPKATGNQSFSPRGDRVS